MKVGVGWRWGGAKVQKQIRSWLPLGGGTRVAGVRVVWPQEGLVGEGWRLVVEGQELVTECQTQTGHFLLKINIIY